MFSQEPLPHPQHPVEVGVAGGVEVAAGEAGELWTVAVYPERRVAQVASAPVGREERVDVLPHDLAPVRHLEQAPVRALADERVAVRQPVSAADVRAEERHRRAALVRPLDLVRFRVDLDNAGRGSAS